MNRRSFITGLSGILAASQAPAIITTPGLLMPVRQIVFNGGGKYYIEYSWDDSLKRNDERLKEIIRDLRYPFISSVITGEWSNQHILDEPGQAPRKPPRPERDTL